MTGRSGWIALALAAVLASGCYHSGDQAHGGTAKTPAGATNQASDESKALKVKDKKPPVLVVDMKTYTFDKMDQGSLGSHVFEISNDGQGDLLLRIQHTSCGCTSVKLGDVNWDPIDPAPRTVVTVPPGGKVDLEMNWNTKDRQGEFRTSANLDTNDPKQSVAVFTVEGEIVPYIQVSQSQVKMDDVRNGAETTSSTHVFSKKYDDLELTYSSSSNPLVSAELEPAEESFLKSVSALSGTKVTIKIQPGLPIGPFSASLMFQTNKEERPEVKIDAVGHVLGDVRLIPFERLDYGIVKVSEGKTLLLFVKIAGDSPIEVKTGKVQIYRRDPSGQGTPVEPFLKLDLTEFTSSKNRWQLKAEVPPGSPGGEFKGVVELETTHPTAKVVKIPVRFEVAK